MRIFVITTKQDTNSLTMCKDTTIFSELQEFFQQNDAHKAINRISGIMNSLQLHKSKIGIEKADNSKYTTIQVLHLLLLFPFFMAKDVYSLAVLRSARCSIWRRMCSIVSCVTTTSIGATSRT